MARAFLNLAKSTSACRREDGREFHKNEQVLVKRGEVDIPQKANKFESEPQDFCPNVERVILGDRYDMAVAKMDK